jgi:hypothetical protein
MFVGFGYLMTFLKHNSNSALGLSFLAACVVLVEAVVVVGGAQQMWWDRCSRDSRYSTCDVQPGRLLSWQHNSGCLRRAG